MYKTVYTTRIKKDIKLLKRQGKDIGKLQKVIDKISDGEELAAKYQNLLTNNWKGSQECHIEPDWLLIYKIKPKENIVYFLRTGSHTNLLENVADFVYLNQKLQEILQEE